MPINHDYREPTWERQSESKFACLTYHKIGAGADQYTVSEKQIRDQLSLLKAEAYVVEGFEQLEVRLRSDQELPARYAILTLDDGHESAMRAADMLEEHGCKATFFLTRDRSRERPGFIRDAQIRELRRRAFSLGTHGTTHRKLTFLPEKECVKELRESKEWLEFVLGEEVGYMAAPGGFINSRIAELSFQLGYVLLGTCDEWLNSPKTLTLPGMVSRVNVRQHFSPSNFRRIIEGSPTFYLWRRVRAAALWIPKQLLPA